MNQITKEELSAYLPYSVKVSDGRTPFELTVHNFTNVYKYITKIYLRPLSQLTTEIEVNGEKFVPIDRLEELYKQLHYDNYSSYFIMSYPKRLPYEILQFLLSLHFDIFGLLNRNLAEPIV